MITTKQKFIRTYLKVIKKKLERPEKDGGLPDEDYESNMMVYAKEAIEKHVWGIR